MYKYTLGLDIGVASIGWAAILLDENDKPYRILDQNATIFKALDNDNNGKLHNVDRRNARSARRVTRRRAERVRLIRKAILDYEILENIEKAYEGTIEETIYQTKVRGLSKPLLPEELVRCLIHYAKNRGFKSNRKNEMIDKKENNKADNETKAMKNAINKVNNIMKKEKCTVTKAMIILKEREGYDRYQNTTDEYHYGCNRSDIEEEARALLNKQLEFGLLGESFIETYMDLLLSQRDFSEGPAWGKYKVDFEKVTGKCDFTEERRGDRSAPSFEKFVLYQKLQNLTFYDNTPGNLEKREKKTLSPTQINELVKMAFEKDKIIKYKTICDLIGVSQNDIKIIDLPRLSKSQHKSILSKYKKEIGVDTWYDFSEEQKLELTVLEENKRFELPIYEIIHFKFFMKYLKPAFEKNSDLEMLLRKDFSILDNIATILSYAKTDEKIMEYLNLPEYNNIPKSLHDFVLSIPSRKNAGVGSLSLSLIRRLNEAFYKGENYTTAMASFGYNPSVKTYESKFNEFPKVEEIEKTFDIIITQPNVRHMLVILRRLYNAIVKQYGEPYRVHVELARDIKNNSKERGRIAREQIENRVRNQNIKLELAKEVGLEYLENKNGSYGKNFSGDDILRYRLWQEQQGKCIYSGEPIPRENLFSNECQVDHILPYSRTYDDSYFNKILSLTKANQEKTNRTPWEWLKNTEKWDEYKHRVEGLYSIPMRKKEKLLFNGVLVKEEFTAQSLHATSYTSKLAVKVFKHMLNVEETDNRVRCFKGQTTSYLRGRYHLNDLTHSYESDTLSRKATQYKFMKPEINGTSDPKKSYIKLSIVSPYNQIFEATLKPIFRETTDETGVKKMRGQSTFDEALQTILNSHHEELSIFMDDILSDMDIRAYSDMKLFEKIDTTSPFELNVGMIINSLVSNLKAQLEKKSRDHHLHHIVDAALVAIMDNGMQMKIAKFHQYVQMVRNGIESVVDENGEVVTAEMLKKAFASENEMKDKRIPNLPLPYPDFVRELKYRIFEFDEAALQRGLSELSNYQDTDVTQVSVKMPYHVYSKKVSGALHKESIYGAKEVEGNKVAVSKKSVAELKEKDLDLIYDKDKGQKEVYLALKNWLAANKKGTPRVANGNPIKKVKIMDPNFNKFLPLSETKTEKGYAAIDGIARILVLKKEGEDKFYFAQMDTFRYMKRKSGNLDFQVQLWFGRDKNNLMIKYSDLEKEGYKKQFELIPGETIAVQTKDCEQMVPCKVVGFTEGKIEVGSLLGDNIEFLSQKLFSKIIKRYYITISTIQNLERIKYNKLGYRI